MKSSRNLFLLGLNRPPEVRYRAAEAVTPRLQRVLDALEFSPAYVKTSTWDVVAWNRAAAAVLMPPSAGWRSSRRRGRPSR